MRKYIFLVSYILILSTTRATVTGVVNDENGAPLWGANVMVDGTNLGAATGEDGKFTIDYEPEGEYVLVASYIGYKKSSITKSARQDNVISLASDVFSSQEVVVTGMASERSIGNTEVSVSLSLIHI